MNHLAYSLRNSVPDSIRRILLRIFDFSSYRNYSNKMANPYRNDPDQIVFEESNVLVGVIHNKTHRHKFWIAACRDLGVSYKVIYLDSHDWLEQVGDTTIDTFLVWPDMSDVTTKTLQDERLRIMEEELGKSIYPSVKSIWLYENKRVQNYWLTAHGFRTPKTWVFYLQEEAERFIKRAQFPLVFKSNLGASGSGVYIVKNRQEALRRTSDIFKNGFRLKGRKGVPRQYGSLFIQEYLDDVREWRMVRIGDSYFGHEKDIRGELHSGSGKVNWNMPPNDAFCLLHEVTEEGGFTSMSVDIFEDGEGALYVNELQTVFGNSIAQEQTKVGSEPGRLLRNESGDFFFQEGAFCQNHLCNLRLEYCLTRLNSQ